MRGHRQAASERAARRARTTAEMGSRSPQQTTKLRGVRRTVERGPRRDVAAAHRRRRVTICGRNAPRATAVTCGPAMGVPPWLASHSAHVIPSQALRARLAVVALPCHVQPSADWRRSAMMRAFRRAPVKPMPLPAGADLIEPKRVTQYQWLWVRWDPIVELRVVVATGALRPTVSVSPLVDPWEDLSIPVTLPDAFGTSPVDVLLTDQVLGPDTGTLLLRSQGQRRLRLHRERRSAGLHRQLLPGGQGRSPRRRLDRRPVERRRVLRAAPGRRLHRRQSGQRQSRSHRPRHEDAVRRVVRLAGDATWAARAGSPSGPAVRPSHDSGRLRPPQMLRHGQGGHHPEQA